MKRYDDEVPLQCYFYICRLHGIWVDYDSLIGMSLMIGSNIYYFIKDNKFIILVPLTPKKNMKID